MFVFSFGSIFLLKENVIIPLALHPPPPHLSSSPLPNVFQIFLHVKSKKLKEPRGQAFLLVLYHGTGEPPIGWRGEGGSEVRG